MMPNPLPSTKVVASRSDWPHELAGIHSTSHNARIVTVVQRALQSTHYPPLRTVRVRETGGTIVISGRVPTYFMKQMAQAVAMAVAFDRTLRNELQVDVAP